MTTITNEINEIVVTITEVVNQYHVTISQANGIPSTTGVPTGYSLQVQADGSVDWDPTAGGGDLLSINNLSDLANSAIARTNLGLEIGVDVQGYSDILANTTASYTTAVESAIALNTAKITNATHTGDVTGSGLLTIQPSAITGKPLETPASGDIVLFVRGGTLYSGDVDAFLSGGGGGVTNLGYTASPTQGIVTSDTGTDATIPATDGANAGLFLPAEKTKLSGIATGATANSSDAFLLARANHTGTQAISTVDGLQTALNSKINTTEIGVSVQGYSSVLQNTTASFTTADETKLDGIATGAEVNVNADWTAIAGDALILNKPTLGTAAAANTTDFATATQGILADSALQPDDIGVSIQGYSSILANTTASFTTADETKLDGIEAGATANSSDAFLLSRVNHTGSQAISTVTGLQTALDAKEPAIVTGATDQYWRGDKTWSMPLGQNEGISSGLISGGQLSINGGDPAKFDLASGSGIIVDLYTTPLDPIVYQITWSAFTAQTVTNLATATVTHVFIDNTGNIVQRVNIPTEAERRQYILLGQLGHTNNTTIGAIIPTPDIAASPISQLRDYADAVGIVNIGNTISPNGANLNINKTLGYLYKLGANFYNSNLSPTQITIAAATAFSFRYRTQTGNGSTTSAIDPNNYDLNGVITTVPINKVTNQRIFLAVNGNVVIQYGQIVYNSISAAITGVQADASAFVQFPNLTENFILIGIITVAQGATDLSNTSQARFFKPSKFGESAASIAGSSVSTFEQVYQNSTPTPELTTNATNGSVDFQCGSGANTDNVFTVKNIAGTVTFSIDGNGSLLNTKLSQLAATTSSELAGIISDETGSGFLVFNTSPTLITPVLGTPASGTLTNCTGLPQSGVTNLVADLGNKQPLDGDLTAIAALTGTGYLQRTGTNTWSLGTVLSDPTTTEGDLIYRSGGVLTRLAIGSTNKILASNGTIPIFENPLVPQDRTMLRQALGSPILNQTLRYEDAGTTQAMTSQRVQYSGVYNAFPVLATGVWFYLPTVGVYTASDTNQIKLFSYSGGTLTEVAATANDGNIWKTAGSFVQIPFVTPVTIARGAYFIGMLYCSSAQTTAPAVRANTSTIQPLGETNNAKLFGHRSTQTSIPASETMNNISTTTLQPITGIY